MKYKLVEKIITKFVGLRPKMYSYLIHNCSNKNTKGTKKYVMIRKRKFDDEN